jgi:hypothetical protein
MGRFSKYSQDIVINVNGEELRLKRVKTEKLQKLMNLTKDEEHMLENLIAYFKDIITSNYPDENPEEVESFLQVNVLTIFEEFQIAYGLIKRADLEKRKAELIEKASK